MAGRGLSSSQSAALHTMRHRGITDKRALAGTGVTDDGLADLVRRGYLARSTGQNYRAQWLITKKGRDWVDGKLDR